MGLRRTRDTELSEPVRPLRTRNSTPYFANFGSISAARLAATTATRVQIPPRTSRLYGALVTGLKLFCLQLRFQNVAGLLMADDTLLKIECHAHPPKAEQVDKFSLPVEEDRRSESRSAPFLARGGDMESKMDSDIFLLRKQGNRFNKLVHPGETLQLGEELMIKSAVRSQNDDDWQFSRMSDVMAHRASKVGVRSQHNDDSDDTVVIVDTDGCRNPILNAVCPDDPTQDEDDPLVTTLTFRVFMMDSMRDGEELQITLRTTACVEFHDCNPNCLDPSSSLQKTAARSRRSVSERTANRNSSIYFKIGIPQGVVRRDSVATLEPFLNYQIFIIPSSFLCVLGLTFVFIFSKMKCF